MSTEQQRSPILGSTTIEQIMQLWPDDRAVKLMSKLGWPCAFCGGRAKEPLTMAAIRHSNDPSLVLTCFRELDKPDGPSEELIHKAAEKQQRK